MPMRMGRDLKRMDKQERMGMNEREDRLAQERDEIAARVARFRATQEKFQREREKFFTDTMQKLRKVAPLSFWP